MTVGNLKIYKDLYVCVYGLNCFDLATTQDKLEDHYLFLCCPFVKQHSMAFICFLCFC